MADSPPPGGFLPPEPQGPEPDLGARPAPPPPPPPAGYAAPAHAQQAPQPPPAWNAPQNQGADNGPAVLGFCLSLSSLGLLVISAGLSTLISIGLAIPGMVQGRKGQQRVREGLTTRNAGLAQAAWIIGIIALVLAALATVFWIFIGVLVATDEGARDEFQREFDRQYERSNAVAAVAVGARLVGAALL